MPTFGSAAPTRFFRVHDRLLASRGGPKSGHRAVRSLARPSFFRMFDLLIASTNPGMKRSRWTHDGVEFERERHSFSSSRHGIVIEIFTLTRSGRRGWSLMVTKEYWWAGPEATPFKNLRWARPLGGQRSDLFDWLRVQETALERSRSLEMPRDQAEANSQSVHAGVPATSSPAWSSDDEGDDDE